MKEAIQTGYMINNIRILLPDSPEIPGLALRGFRGEPDYPLMLAVIDGSKDVDGIERSDSLEDIQHSYQHLHNCDPFQDMIFAEVDGVVVGYSRVWWEQEVAGDWIGMHIGFLSPNWRRMGIGTAMSSFNEERLKEIVTTVIEEDQLPDSTTCFYQVYADDTENDKINLLNSLGYQPVRYEHYMQRPLDKEIQAVPMPGGLEVRTVQDDEMHKIIAASDKAFQDHWGYVPLSEEEKQSWLTDPDFNPDLWIVAWDGNQVAGSVLNFVNASENEEYKRKRGYTEGISVRRPWRKRGLARSLLTQSLLMFQDMGYDEAYLSVDTDNLSGAHNLYKSVGFQVQKVQFIYRKLFLTP